MHRPLATLAVLPLIAATGTAQLRWTQLAPATIPHARHSSALADHQQRGFLVLFGGESQNGLLRNDTWLWNGSDWRALGGSGPPARRSHAIGYHSGQGQMVLFGGRPCLSGCANLGDTWVMGSGLWVQQFPANSPLPRRAHAMATEETGLPILFGGVADGGALLDDTWSWTGTDWFQLNAVVKPLARRRHAMAQDQFGRLVLFGGQDQNGNHLGDTWQFAGFNWTRVFPVTSPSARSRHRMAFDQLRGRLLLFGGEDGAGVLADTWEWDGFDWLQRSPSFTPGPLGPRQRYAMAYDQRSEHTVLFGGDPVTAPVLGDTWIAASDSPASARTFGAGCPGSVGVPQLWPGNAPWIGHGFALTLMNLPTAPGAAFVIGGGSRTSWGTTPLPAPLDPFGMPGCSALVPPNHSFFVPTLQGSGQWSTAICTCPNLLGLGFYFQALVLDPGAGNAAGAVVTNGVEVVLGAR